jgi:hypothetical protein
MYLDSSGQQSLSILKLYIHVMSFLNDTIYLVQEIKLLRSHEI